MSRVHHHRELWVVLQRLHEVFERHQPAGILVHHTYEFLDVFVDLALRDRASLTEDVLQHVSHFVRVDLAATVLVCQAEGLFHLHEDGGVVRLRVQQRIVKEHL